MFLLLAKGVTPAWLSVQVVCALSEELKGLAVLMAVRLVVIVAMESRRGCRGLAPAWLVQPGDRWGDCL